MDEKNLPSSSDESDVDFVPKEEEDNSDSGSEVSDCETSEGETKSGKSRKRKKRTKKYGKKSRANESEEKEEDNVEEEKKTEVDVDALWADFKKDVESKKTAESSQPNSKTENAVNKSSEVSVEKTSNPKPKTTPNFPNNKKVGGLSSVLSQIGKKNKMSTLQKSQMDWNNFKKTEGIEEEIKVYNRGKDGYLDKQDFLQRTDLRQFEIEKDLRTARRKF